MRLPVLILKRVLQSRRLIPSKIKFLSFFHFVFAEIELDFVGLPRRRRRQLTQYWRQLFILILIQIMIHWVTQTITNRVLFLFILQHCVALYIINLIKLNIHHIHWYLFLKLI